MKIFIQILFISFFTAGIIGAQGIEFEKGSWSDIKNKAKSSDKIIFVDAYTTWCGPCKWMDANVFTDKDVGDYFNTNFVNYKMDMEKGEGIAFADEYNVRAYPTLLFIDGKGNMVHKQLGGSPPEKFLNTGKTANDPAKRIGSLMAKYKSGERSKAFLHDYVLGMVDAGIPAGSAAMEFFDMQSKEEMKSKENFMILTRIIDGMDHEAFPLLIENREAYGDALGSDQVDGMIKQMCKRDLFFALRKGDDEFNKNVASIKKMDIPFSGELVSYGNVQAAKSKGDYPSIIKHTKEYSKKYVNDNWSELNSMAWDIYEDEKNSDRAYLKLGAKMAKKSIKLESNYFNNDTMAALLYRLGSYKKAMKYADLAVALAKNADSDYQSTAELIEMIKTKM